MSDELMWVCHDCREWFKPQHSKEREILLSMERGAELGHWSAIHGTHDTEGMVMESPRAEKLRMDYDWCELMKKTDTTGGVRIADTWMGENGLN